MALIRFLLRLFRSGRPVNRSPETLLSFGKNSGRKRVMGRILAALFTLAALAVLSLVACDRFISGRAAPYIFDGISDIPGRKAGLLLGTSRYLKNGHRNPFFEYRIRAAVELLKMGKIEYIIASGDNRTPEYNEPRIMKEELVERGVPPERIYPDYAGFRTLDSVVRCGRIFGQESFIIISQKFHNERAVFIARSYGLEAYGFNARTVSRRYALKTMLREYLARVRAFIDVYITGKGPRFLGEEIILE